MPEHKIILADDHKILREGLKSLIEKDPFFRVVGQAKNGEELLALLKTNRSDIVVLDLSMPQMDGIATLKEIRRTFPKIKILILTMQKDQEHFKQAMAGGASGYILKEDAYDQLMLAIKIVLKGKSFVSPTLEHFLADQYIRSLEEGQESSPNILTKRELQILKLIAQGLSNKNIASKLKLSIRTVEAHRGNLTNKLGIKNTANLVKYAISKGLV